MKLQLVDNWKHLWKSWSLWFAASGIAIPEILQLIADNSDTFIGLDAGWKSIIRMVCLIGVIVTRPVKQVAVSGTPEPKEKP